MSALFDPLDPSVAFLFDTIEKESFNIESQVTEHPVEKSSLNADTVPDHTILKQVQVSVSGTLSNTPIIDRGGWTPTVKNIVISAFAPFQASQAILLGAGGFNAGVEVFGNIIRQEQQTIAFTGLEYPAPQDFIADEIRKLTAWRKASKLLTWFALSGHTVDNLLITGIATDLEGRVPGAIAAAVVSIELKRVKIVSTVAVSAPKPKVAAGLPKKKIVPRVIEGAVDATPDAQPFSPNEQQGETIQGDDNFSRDQNENPQAGGDSGAPGGPSAEDGVTPFVSGGAASEWDAKQFGTHASGVIGVFGSY